MDKIVGEPANVPPEVRRALLCHPPEGPFDYNSPSLKWVKRRYGKILYDSAFILKVRLPDFRKGEDQRGLCSFYTQATKPGSKKLKENDASAANTPVPSGCSIIFKHFLEARIDTKLEGSMLHCSYGPEDYRGKEAKAVPAEKGTRIKLTDLGRSV
ncbi:hypothetical protein COCOBI_19-1890 [Coccomyxa sp. Obi]|nr:hypothetical protein COCOBI_19-1890 [Coccomyxa sp. Obi]